MKKSHVLLTFFVIIVVFSTLSSHVETLPRDVNPRAMGVFHPEHWFARETPGCPYGYQCYLGHWTPTVQIYRYPIWVFGISSWEYGVGGTLNFRKLPDYPCTQHCFEEIPILYTAEVMYVPPWETPDISPEDVPLTYIPPGRYVVTSPSFTIYRLTKIWYFPDDGTGQQMNAVLEPEEQQYSPNDTVRLFLWVFDQWTANPIQADSIIGEIMLPDGKKKTITTDMWSWNDLKYCHQCTWDLLDDNGNPSDPIEGVYNVFVTVKKAGYHNVNAATSFMVCYDVQIELKLIMEEEPPIMRGDTVQFIATITDKDGEPVSGNLAYEFLLPLGFTAELDWKEDPEGVYKASYTTELSGTHFLRVWLEDVHGICSMGEASLEFEVIGSGEFDCPFSEEESRNLAHTYAPYMYFYKGNWGFEQYFPTVVEVMLDNSTFHNYDKEEVPGYQEADNKGEFIGQEQFRDPEYYLDLNDEGCTIDPDLINEQDPRMHLYYRVSCVAYQEELYIVIQYWFFYIFNEHFHFPTHEGEWEMITVLLDYDSKDPLGAAYSQHLWCEYRSWDRIEKVEDPQTGKETHPAAYIAKGSHAAYFENNIFGTQPVLDITSDHGEQGLPSGLTPIVGFDWLEYGGNWGYHLTLEDHRPDRCPGWGPGPCGPKQQGSKWEYPVAWTDGCLYGEELEKIRSPYTSFYLSCPADMLITNSAGQRVGWINGEFVQEIPHSYVQSCGEEELYFVTGADYYTVEIFGTGEGVVNLVLTINSWNTAKTLRYRDVPVTAVTKAVLCTDSDLSLNVDANQDGSTDFTVLPEVVELSSPQPIKPLQRGTEMLYEVTLTNQGDASTFTLYMNTPLGWEYSLSSDTVTLNPGESATVLVTVTSPSDILVQDYSFRVEAFSSDNSMGALLDLTASSKAELVAENITVSEGEDVVLTALVSNMGMIDAENVKVQFFNGPPGSDLLGEQTIHVVSGETATTSVRCSLPDGFYTFSVIIDPENLISESCELNNELTIQYLLDRTTPEAEIFFDPESEDLAVRGVDNLDPSVDVSVEEEPVKNRNIRTYTLTDHAGNTLKLQLEIKRTKHELKAEIIGLEYNDTPVAVPKNSIKVEYILEQGKVKILNQFFIIGDIKVHLIYDRTKDQTKTIINGSTEYQEGLMLVVISTSKGDFEYRFKKI